MTVGVGDEKVAAEDAVKQVAAATPDLAREGFGWRDRLRVAFGGAAVAVIVVLLISSWQDGLRASTFQQLRADIRTGSIHQWYVAEDLQDAPIDIRRAESSTIRGDLDDPVGDGGFTPAMGDPNGGILVWRTWGEPGWRVATADNVQNLPGQVHRAATEESAALVRELRAAEVPMKPFEWGGMSALDLVYRAGAILVLGWLILGPPTRLGTKWFWFWVVVLTPLALGAIAYAVAELIGFRRRPDVALDKRVRGGWGLLGTIVAAIVISELLSLLRSWDIPIPF